MDCCCLNRPFDDTSHSIVRAESTAVRSILLAISEQHWILVSGTVLRYEILQNPSEERRRRVLSLEGLSTEWIALDPEIEARGRELHSSGIAATDALHLASAEKARVDIFLTTDYKLLRAANRHSFPFQAMNPLDFQAGGVKP